MRIDVSEVKTFRECKRKHLYSSRNRFHLRPITPNDNLIFGTQFHEALAMMYLGTSLDKILEWVNLEVTDKDALRMMNTMVTGYYEGPYQEDKDNFVVIDVEKSFNYPIGVKDVDPETGYLDSIHYEKDADGNWIAVSVYGEVLEPIIACGSIDMVCIDVRSGKLVGFEHKTAKNFRPDVYNLVDEQPRLYSWALKKILEDYHAQGKYTEVQETGPIYLNQVKKLLSKFSYQRVACEYKENDLERFMQAFVNTAGRISEQREEDTLPEPSYMKCQMCDYATLCMHYGYADINKDDLVEEFEGEYEVRDHDHLDEKAQRHNEEAD